MKKSIYFAASALGALAFSNTAFAQDADTLEEARSPGDGTFADTSNVQRDVVSDNVVVVTAQRRAQSLQSVPLAVSAFDSEALEAQQIENSSDLQLTLPNVSFTKGNFTASSFTIRGIGDLCVGVSCDSATAIHLNDEPLFSTRLFETEFFDLERIEVLRGPQGTLFGRNATAGVVNLVTAKPELGDFGGEIEGSYGNFNAFEGRGMINIPLGDTFGARVAGIYLKRDGYTENLFNNTDIDGREIYSVRGTLLWEPTPDTTVTVLGSYFREDDDRLRIQKQKCQRDPTGVLGCLNTRLDFDKSNTNSTFTGTLTSREFLGVNGIPAAFGLGSLYGPDSFANFDEPNDVRQVRTAFTPEYFSDEITAQAKIQHSFGAISASLSGTYQETEVDSRQDYNLGIPDRSLFVPGLSTLAAAGAGQVPGLPAGSFAPIAQALIPNGPNGPLCTSATRLDNRGAFEGFSECNAVPLSFDRSQQETQGYSVEGIVSSDFDGAFNFLLGGIYAENKFSNNSYFVNAFAIDYVAGILGAFNSFPNGLPPSYLATSFFHSNTTDFELNSYGIFGEVYVDISDTLKLTGGLRYNDDTKSVTARSTLASFLNPFSNDGDPFASPFVGSFDADPGVAGNQLVQQREASFDAITGRVVLDWQWSPDNLLYASYSRGYKSGGINPPLQPIFAVPEQFGEETIDAFEIGSKNVIGNGALVLNLTAFYYKYKDLQLSRIVARTAVNDTIDADIYGAEVEAIVRPDPDILVNLTFSYLNAKVAGDQFFSNPRDPGGGDPNAAIIKDITNGALCAVTGGALGGPDAFVNAINPSLGLRGVTEFPSDGGIASSGAFGICSVLTAQAAAIGAGFGGINVLSPGVEVNIRGNKLPQAPNVKASAGFQYTHNFDSGMSLVPRVDIAFTGEQFGNVFNGNVNKIEAFTQVNAQVQLNGLDERFFVRGFIQNVFDSSSTTGLYLTDASSGLFTNIFTLEPRRYGIAAGFRF